MLVSPSPEAPLETVLVYSQTEEPAGRSCLPPTGVPLETELVLSLHKAALEPVPTLTVVQVSPLIVASPENFALRWRRH